MSEDYTTRISASLDPLVIAGNPDYDEDTRPVLGQAETAMSEGFEGLKRIYAAKAAAFNDPTLTREGALLKTDDFARKLLGSTANSWSRAIDTLNNNITKLDKEMSASVEPRAQANMASEIRAHFKDMKWTMRFLTLNQAIEDGDEITVTSVLGAKPYLSGLDAWESSTLLTKWNEKQRPVEAKRLRAMRSTVDMMNERYSLLQSEWKKAVGDIRDYQPSKADGRPVPSRIVTPEQIRAKKEISDSAFAPTR